MNVAVANDHRGIEAKEQIKAIVCELGHTCLDLGTNSDAPMDYPDLAYLAAKSVADKKSDRAILVCGTGIGMCIAANKVHGVRAALCYDELNARISRQHNDSNILCLSGDLLGSQVLRKMVEVWLSTEFSGGRHQRRVSKIAAIEQGLDPSTVSKQ
ncbi:MAG: ribose 5-phosphate isomerase B [Planctomycetes bacterium GWF2_42_9]|nr:MAG: ribose 5-phosphate isomerase B [Planctomycetes bacterium GWF2_42_9]HAL45315.1 ribose 5-phosphate isomerase B [Phycisphaerales bacterium]